LKKSLPFLIIFVVLLTACSLLNTEEQTSVTLTDAGKSISVNTIPGVTVDQLLNEQKIQLSPLDKVTPPLTTFLNGGELIVITRISEEFSIVESVLPFEQQTIKNESLSEGQTVLIQPGVNGRLQSTHRILYEDGKEVSRTIVKEEIIQPPKPEILMIGVQSPFSAVDITGVIAYISSSNAWVMDENTGNRKIVVSTGDLDGRIFSISFDRKWLLFSRSAEDTSGEKINSLWLVDITKDEPKLINTGIRDVVHYADWVPGRNRTFSYSTVEPRATAPGWQANNDLHIYRFDVDGEKADDTVLVDSNSGGIYGWWGSTYQWSPDGTKLAYARPDSIGIVNLKSGELESLIDFAPYQPKTDWAWVPGIQWSAQGSVLFTVVNNVENGAQTSDSYDLAAILIETKRVIPLVSRCGLFCYPTPSNTAGEQDYFIGFLSAILPDQSENSRYALSIMDRDGSNRKKLYPGEGVRGLDPQLLSWSPADEAGAAQWLAFMSQGNMMLVEIPSGTIKQVTGDGSISKIIWR